MSHSILLNSHFRVDAGFNSLDFISVNGLQTSVQVITTHLGSSPDPLPHKNPGAQSVGNVVIRRFMKNGDNDFSNWMNTVNLGTVERRDITISLLNHQHEPVYVWRLLQAFPVRHSFGSLDASRCEAMWEELEITFDRLVSSTV